MTSYFVNGSGKPDRPGDGESGDDKWVKVLFVLFVLYMLALIVLMIAVTLSIWHNFGTSVRVKI